MVIDLQSRVYGDVCEMHFPHPYLLYLVLSVNLCFFFSI